MKMNLFLGTLGAPAPSVRLKCNPLIPLSLGSSLISGAASLGSSIMGSMNQNKANRLTKEENEKNRSWQSEENQKARDYNTEMWNLQNAYNTPSAQRERLKEAGYNPWMSGSGSPQSVAGAVAPSPSGGPSTSSQFGAYRPADGFGLSSALDLLFRGKKISADVSNQNVDTMLKALRSYSDSLKNLGDEGKKAAYGNLQKIMKSLGYDDKMVNDLNRSINYEYLNTKLNADKQSLEYFLLNKYGDKQGKAKYDETMQTISNLQQEFNVMKSQKRLNDASSNKLAKDAALSIAKTLTENESRQYAVSLLKAQADMYSNNMLGNSYVGEMGTFGKILNTIVFYLQSIFNPSSNIKIK